MSTSSRTPRRLIRDALLATLTAAGLLAGCGLGPGSTPGGVRLTVSRDFGAHAQRQTRQPRLRGSETVMSLLLRNAKVRTRYGGGFVQSIDGRAGGQRAGRPIDWFYYVNGVQASKGAAETVVHRGDSVWWDLHDWSQTGNVPAVVGSFPEPFLHGLEGRRLPVRVECADPGGEPCKTVTAKLRALGVPAAVSAIVAGEAQSTLRVLVGPLAKLYGVPAARNLQRGPAASGVYTRPASDGASIALLDGDGHATRTLAAGSGLLAATRYGQGAPVWVVAGTDAAGLTLAARALSEATLAHRFAVAVSATGQPLAVPQPSP
jgi:hypothetical protein